MKRFLSVLLCFVLLITIIPMTIFSTHAATIITIEQSEKTSVNIDEDNYFTILEFTPKESGYYQFYSMGNRDTTAWLYDENDKIIAEDDDYGNSQNFMIVYYLEAGVTYDFEVQLFDETESAIFDVIVEPCKGAVVVDLDVVIEPTNTVYYKGFAENGVDYSGLRLKATMSDGTVEFWGYNSDDGEDNLDYINGWYLEYNTIENDKKAYIDFRCGCAQLTYDLTLIDNNVKSIEVVNQPKIELYENSDGFYEDKDTFYYFYDLPQFDIKVNYTDGSSEVFDFYDTVKGAEFSAYDNQNVKPWTVGKNTVYIDLLGKKTQVYVTILECPFVSYTLNSNPSKVYVFGDYETGYMSENEYCLYPEDLTGLSFTVVYADGSKKTFTDKDIDMKNNTISGDEYVLKEVAVKSAGSVKAGINYKGLDIDFTVNVIETKIKSIEILSDPVKTNYEYIYYPDFTGMTVKVTYKDGTSKTVTANKNTLVYDYDSDSGDLDIGIKVNRDIVHIYRESHLEGEYVFKLACLGVDKEYKGIKYSENRIIKNIDVANANSTGDGMAVTLNYQDGTKETLTYDAVAYSTPSDNKVVGYALTKNGIIDYEINTVKRDGVVKMYYIKTLGFVVMFRLQASSLGDVDGDDKVTIMDATAIQRHVAKLVEIPNSQFIAADTDKDGQISIMDATLIQRFIAKLIPQL